MLKISTVDTGTAVWVSTAEKMVLRETRKFSRKFGVVSAPVLYKKQAARVEWGANLVHCKSNAQKSPLFGRFSGG